MRESSLYASSGGSVERAFALQTGDWGLIYYRTRPKSLKQIMTAPFSKSSGRNASGHINGFVCLFGDYRPTREFFTHIETSHINGFFLSCLTVDEEWFKNLSVP